MILLQRRMEMNKINKIGIITTLLILGISIIGQPTFQPAKASPGNLQPGDIIQIHCLYGGIWNLHYWTHTMLYIGGNMVIHAGGQGGVHYSTIPEAYAAQEAAHGPITNKAYLRVKSGISVDINDVLNFADNKEGQTFDSWSISPLHWEKQYNPSPDHPGYGYYCTELVWASYLSDGLEIEETPDEYTINPLEVYYSGALDVTYCQYPDDVPPIFGN
jgi:uncharacterized protein YycO